MGLNQIYKVVWSKTKGCYVVVSELAKRVGRNKTKAVVVATAAMAMVVAPVMVGTNTVDAAIAIGSTTDNTFEKGTANAKDGASIAIGSDVDASVGDRITAIGNNTKSQGGRNTVIGAFATAGYDGSDKKREAISVLLDNRLPLVREVTMQKVLVHMGTKLLLLVLTRLHMATLPLPLVMMM